jgi:hypothetical protein
MQHCDLVEGALRLDDVLIESLLRFASHFAHISEFDRDNDIENSVLLRVCILVTREKNRRSCVVCVIDLLQCCCRDETEGAAQQTVEITRSRDAWFNFLIRRMCCYQINKAPEWKITGVGRGKITAAPRIAYKTSFDRASFPTLLSTTPSQQKTQALVTLTRCRMVLLLD